MFEEIYPSNNLNKKMKFSTLFYGNRDHVRRRWLHFFFELSGFIPRGKMFRVCFKKFSIVFLKINVGGPLKSFQLQYTLTIFLTCLTDRKVITCYHIKNIN